MNHELPNSLLESAPVDAGQGGKRRERAVYMGVIENFGLRPNAERRRPSVFQQSFDPQGAKPNLGLDGKPAGRMAAT
jgi:hypothetical protein